MTLAGDAVTVSPMTTTQTNATVLAALALAAQTYYDPTPCYAAIAELYPHTDWTAWIASVDQVRKEREDRLHGEAL